MSKNQVIIIGGGISGLAAAYELIQNGITNIVIIEAQNRLGGRILSMPTDEKNSSIIELGPQWIHGEKKNPVFELCSELDMIDKNTKTVFSNVFYYATQDGKKVDDFDVEKTYEYIENIFDEIEDETQKMNKFTDKSIGEMIDTKFRKLIKILRTTNNLNNIKIEIIKSILDARLKNAMEETACDSLEELSAFGWAQFKDCEGDPLINLKNGYSQLTQHLCAQIPPERIILNEVVTRIQWPDESVDKDELENYVVTVTTYNTVNQTESIYYGLQCLCTISLGCLKAYQNLFEPALPKNKIEAIDSLGFGIVNKVFIVFEEPLFQQDVQGLEIFWRNDLYFELQSVKKWKLRNKSFFKSFTTFEFLQKQRNIICTSIAGEDAKYIEDLEDECLIEVFHEMLSKVFIKINIPKPKAVIKSSWYSNEYIKGSCVYIRINSSTDHIKELAEPLNSKVYFAGDATNENYYGTVHGAFQSGRDAAQKMIENLEKSEVEEE